MINKMNLGHGMGMKAAWNLNSEMVQALLAANSQGAELQRLMVDGALEHVSLWMTWERMKGPRDVAGNQKDLLYKNQNLCRSRVVPCIKAP